MGRPKKDINYESLGRLYIYDKLTLLDISKKLGCSSSTIKRRLREILSYKSRRINTRQDPKTEENRQIIRLYSYDNKTISQISKLLGKDRETIRRRLEFFGIHRNTEKDFREFHPISFDRTDKEYIIKGTTELNNALILLYQKGESVLRISELLKIDRGTVYRRIRYLTRNIKFYTRICKRCSAEYKTEFKNSKICSGCDLSFSIAF